MMKYLLVLTLVLLGACGAPTVEDTSDFDAYLEQLMQEPYTADTE